MPNTPPRRVTTNDVAREAGVSRATVSYVLNDAPNQRISEATRESVRAAAKRLGYEPSAAARVLRLGRSDLVVMVLPDVPLGAAMVQFMRRLSTALHRLDRALVVHPLPRGAEDARHLWHVLSPGAALRMDGHGSRDAELFRHLGIPAARVVYSREELAQAQAEDDGCVLVLPNEACGLLQVQCVVNAGHHRLAYAYPSDRSLAPWAEPRLAGVREGCAERGLDAPEVTTVSDDLSSCRAAARAWVQSGVTAVCAYNDDLAIALLEAAAIEGIAVPQDLAVIGVDDVPAAATSTPPLTTVGFEAAGLVDAFARRLVQAMDSGEIACHEAFAASTRLVRRDSV